MREKWEFTEWVVVSSHFRLPPQEHGEYLGAKAQAGRQLQAKATPDSLTQLNQAIAKSSLFSKYPTGRFHAGYIGTGLLPPKPAPPISKVGKRFPAWLEQIFSVGRTYFMGGWSKSELRHPLQAEQLTNQRVLVETVYVCSYEEYRPDDVMSGGDVDMDARPKDQKQVEKRVVIFFAISSFLHEWFFHLTVRMISNFQQRIFFPQRKTKQISASERIDNFFTSVPSRGEINFYAEIVWKNNFLA